MSLDRQKQTELRAERLEAYRGVIVEAWRRQGVSNTSVAEYTQRGPSLISKIKNGRAPICAKVSNQLIDFLGMDRLRLFLAIEVAGDGALYFDPAFKNVCYASLCFLKNLIERLEDEADRERKAIFAAFSKDTLERVAGQAGTDVAEQFFGFSPTYTRWVAQV